MEVSLPNLTEEESLAVMEDETFSEDPSINFANGLLTTIATCGIPPTEPDALVPMTESSPISTLVPSLRALSYMDLCPEPFLIPSTQKSQTR